MCRALVRGVEASAATVIVTRNAVHAAPSGIRRGILADARRATAHEPQATSSTASRLLSDCHGNRSSGAVASNGASIASRSTPPAATALDMSALLEYQESCHADRMSLARHDGCICAA